MRLAVPVRVRLLGTGSADGWPNPWCGCASCTAAAESGAVRGQTSALVDERAGRRPAAHRAGARRPAGGGPAGRGPDRRAGRAGHPRPPRPPRGARLDVAGVGADRRCADPRRPAGGPGRRRAAARRARHPGRGQPGRRAGRRGLPRRGRPRDARRRRRGPRGPLRRDRSRRRAPTVGHRHRGAVRTGARPGRRTGVRRRAARPHRRPPARPPRRAHLAGAGRRAAPAGGGHGADGRLRGPPRPRQPAASRARRAAGDLGARALRDGAVLELGARQGPAADRPPRARRVLVLGGARSGKCAYAEQ